MSDITEHAPGQSPYRDLFVYYLSGYPKISTELFSDKSFIGNWQEENDSFLFFSCSSESKVQHLLCTQTELELIDSYEMPYEAWHGDKVTPFRVDQFYIFPPWDKGTPSKTDLLISLDPGVVFGTGTHPTTHNCLEALELIYKTGNISSVLDLGTGTGLLALAAAKLGAKSVLAVDFNLLAARTTDKNVVQNSLKDTIITVQGLAQDFISINTDLVIANIHYDAMRPVLESDGFLDKKWFILSGLLRSQARDVKEKLSSLPVQIIQEWSQDGIWHTYLGRIND